jgi:dipeptidyl aminopeptidase/acylaminoacyl peptidase
MTSPRRFEQDLPALLADMYVAGTPDYRDDLVQQVARVRQRPAWTFPGRWLPMELATERVPMTRLPMRQLGVLALITILIAAMFAVYIGSQQRRLPEPFGRAANGSVAFVTDGDIYIADPVTGKTTAIVVGPEIDDRPVYSLDGTRVVFERKVEGDGGVRPGMLFVAGDDGRGLVQVTPEPLAGLDSWSFSPDGRSIVALVVRQAGPAIMVLASDGSGEAAYFDVGATLNDGPPQYRPDGTEIMFIGREPAQANRGVYALSPETGEVRSVIPPPAGSMDIFGASWSPDGAHLAYGTHDTSAEALTSRTHVVAVDGTGDLAVDTSPESIADAGFAWSNDGTRLIVARYYSGDGSKADSAILPIDRSSQGIKIACPPGAPAGDCTADWSWSPDDSLLLGTIGDSQFLADPATGQIRVAPWTATGHPAWQRVAP